MVIEKKRFYILINNDKKIYIAVDAMGGDNPYKNMKVSQFIKEKKINF